MRKTTVLGLVLSTLALATPAPASTSGSAALRTTFLSFPYGIIGNGSTLPAQAPGKTKIIEVTVRPKNTNSTEVLIQGQLWVVARGQTRRFKTNKLLGIGPRITRFTLRCPFEGQAKTFGGVSFKK
jgi:hypothetical protein